MSVALGFRRRNFLRLSCACLVSGFAVSCLSPTLPLPPPSRPDVSPPDASGFATLQGRVPDETTAIAQNLANGRLVGQVTDETGTYELDIPARAGDRIAVWYRLIGKESGSVVVEVPAADDDTGMGGAAGASN